MQINYIINNIKYISKTINNIWNKHSACVHITQYSYSTNGGHMVFWNVGIYLSRNIVSIPNHNLKLIAMRTSTLTLKNLLFCHLSLCTGPTHFQRKIPV
jgi:hypothetical protein